MSPYPLLMLAGIAVSIAFWARVARRDERLLVIYVAALVSAFLGAKIVYLAAEGWMFWDAPERWMIWATGKTILGALLGGYAGVEIAKKLTGYTQPTGDWFALIAPAGIVLGRVGCLLHGCCLGEVCEPPKWWTLSDARGVPRWPAVPMEIGFNLLALAFFGALHFKRRGAEKRRDAEGEGGGQESKITSQTLGDDSGRRGVLATRAGALGGRAGARPSDFRGQLFHIYLVAYGLFRFAHEFLRATPRVTHGFSGYQVAALAVAALGIIGFVRRRRASRLSFSADETAAAFPKSASSV